MQCHMHPILSDRKQDIAFNSTLFTAEQGSFMVFSFSLDGHWQCPLDYEVDTIKCTLFCSGHWRVGFLWLPTIGGTLCNVLFFNALPIVTLIQIWIDLPWGPSTLSQSHCLLYTIHHTTPAVLAPVTVSFRSTLI